MAKKKGVSQRGLVSIPESRRKYPTDALKDSRIIWDFNSPHLADKLSELMIELLGSADMEERLEGANLVSKFQRKIFRDQPQEHISLQVKHGGIDEETAREISRRLGRDTKTNMVAADATIVTGGDGDIAPVGPAEGEAPGTEGDSGPVPGMRQGQKRTLPVFRPLGDRKVSGGGAAEAIGRALGSDTEEGS